MQPLTNAPDWQMHQFDDFESSFEPWAPCDRNGQGPQCKNKFEGRISCFLVFRDMRLRRDRVAVPLISNDGGMVISDGVQPKCVFGDE